MLSGRYCSNYLCRHWSSHNKSGYCDSAFCDKYLETIEHIIGQCNQYQDVRSMMWQKWIDSSAFCPPLQEYVQSVMVATPTEQTQLVLDPTADPVIISLVQIYGHALKQHVLYLSRTHCWNIHKTRCEMLDNLYNTEDYFITYE